MRVISEDNHGANMKSSMREGDTAAIPVPIKPQEAPSWGGSANSLSYGDAIARASADPGGQGGLLNRLADKRHTHMQPVSRPAKPA